VEVRVDQRRRYEETANVDHGGPLSCDTLGYVFYNPVAYADVE
jgi:hypothetical protein